MSNTDVYGPKLPDDYVAPTKDFVLARDPKKAMQEMMDTMDALYSVYERENTALEKSNTREFLNLQQEKIEIAKNYQSGTRQLLERKAEFKDTSSALKDRLLKKQDSFNAITVKNLELLGRVRKGINRLNERIMDGVRKEAQKDSLNYKYDGELLKNERPVSIGVSESA